MISKWYVPEVCVLVSKEAYAIQTLLKSLFAYLDRVYLAGQKKQDIGYSSSLAHRLIYDT